MRKVNGNAIPIYSKNHNVIDNKSVTLIWKRFKKCKVSSKKKTKIKREAMFLDRITQNYKDVNFSQIKLTIIKFSRGIFMKLDSWLLSSFGRENAQ